MIILLLLIALADFEALLILYFASKAREHEMGERFWKQSSDRLAKAWRKSQREILSLQAKPIPAYLLED